VRGSGRPTRKRPRPEFTVVPESAGAIVAPSPSSVNNGGRSEKEFYTKARTKACFALERASVREEGEWGQEERRRRRMERREEDDNDLRQGKRRRQRVVCLLGATTILIAASPQGISASAPWDKNEEIYDTDPAPRLCARSGNASHPLTVRFRSQGKRRDEEIKWKERGKRDQGPTRRQRSQGGEEEGGRRRKEGKKKPEGIRERRSLKRIEKGKENRKKTTTDVRILRRSKERETKCQERDRVRRGKRRVDARNRKKGFK